MTFRKVVLFIVLGLILLVVIAGIFLKVYLTDERLRAAIEPMLEEQLQRDVTIERFEFRLLRSFPDMSIGVENLAIHTPDRPDLASVERIWVDVPLLPLLQSKVIIKELNIETPRVLVEVYEDLSTNLIEFSASEGEEPVAGGSSVDEVNLERIQLTGGQIAYLHADGTMLAVTDLNAVLTARLADVLLLAGTIRAGDFFFETGGISYADGWRVGLDLDTSVNLDSSWLEIRTALLSVDDLNLSIEGRVTDYDADRIGVDLALSAPDATVPALWSLLPAALTKEVEGLQGEGQIAVAATLKGHIAEEEMPALDARITVGEGSIHYPGLPQPIEGLTLEAHITNEELNVENFTASASAASLRAAGVVRNFADPTLIANVDLEADLGSINDFYPLEDSTELEGRLSADASLQGRLNDPSKFTGEGLITLAGVRYASPSLEQPVENLSGRARLDQNRLQIEDLSLTSGRSDFRFDGVLEDYGAWLTTGAQSTPLLTGRLSSDYLDVTEQLSEDTTSVGPVELPDLRMDVSFSAGELVYAPFSLRDVGANITLENGVFGFQEAQAGLFDGLLNGSGSFDLSDPMHPLFQGALAVADVRVSRFFSTFTSMEQITRIGAFLDGLFDSQLELSLAMDKDFNPALETFLAQGVFGAKQGVLKDMPLQKALATYTGVSALTSLPIRSWSHHFNISGERLHVQDLSLAAGDFQVSLNGSQSFDGNIDYSFSLQLPESVSGALANAPIQGALQPLSQLANAALVDPASGRVVLDLTAEGAFTSPTIRLSGEMMRSRLQARATMLAGEARAEAQARLDSLKNAARAKAEAEFDQQKQIIGDQVREEAGDLLGGVLDSTAASTGLDSLKEKGGDLLQSRIRGLLNRKKNNNE